MIADKKPLIFMEQPRGALFIVGLEVGGVEVEFSSRSYERIYALYSALSDCSIQVAEVPS